MQYNPLGTLSSQPARLMLSNHGNNGETILFDNRENTKSSIVIKMPSSIDSFIFPFYGVSYESNVMVVNGHSGIRLRTNRTFDFDNSYPSTTDSDTGIFIHTTYRVMLYASVKVELDYMIFRYEGAIVNNNTLSDFTTYEATLFVDGTIQVVTERMGVNGRTVLTDSTKGIEIPNGSGLLANSTNVLKPDENFNTYTLIRNTSYVLPVPSEEHRPSPPIDVVARNVSLTSMKIYWNTPDIQKTLYSAIRITDGNNYSKYFRVKPDIGVSGFDLSGLNQETLYNITINGIGRGSLESDGTSINVRTGSVNDMLPANAVGRYSNQNATLQMKRNSGERVLLSTKTDDDSKQLTTLDFQFPFYGVAKSIYAGTNSYITFGASSTAYNNFSLSSTAGLYINASDNASNWLAEKLISKGKALLLRNEGERMFVSGSNFTYEVTLFSDGVIQLVYGQSASPSVDLKSFITSGKNNINTDIYYDNPKSDDVYIFIPKLNPIEGYYVIKNGSYVLKDDRPTYPIPTITSNSKDKISKNTGADRTNLKFKFDKKVTQWTVNVGGTSETTGYIADSGGTVEANTEITAIIDGNELQKEGVNKVNIYGKDESGNWTPYEAE